MSNLYQLAHGTLRIAQQRQFDVPIIKLGDFHFAKVGLEDNVFLPIQVGVHADPYFMCVGVLTL